MRDPLTAVQLAERFGLKSARAAKHHINLGRKILSEDGVH